MALYEAVAGLAVQIDSYAVEGLAADVSSGFHRRTTVLRLRGAGEEGVAEDVSYDGVDHEALQAAGPVLPLAGAWTLDELSQRLETLELFPSPASRPASLRYRRSAFECAALDLALRQAGRSLAEVLGLQARPVRFVVSLRLGEPPSLQPVRSRLLRYPGLRFKLDPTSSWTEEIVAGLRSTGAVDCLDLKGHYRGSEVDQEPDPVLYRRLVEAFPDAWIEDPALTDETGPILAAERDRITWDAPIESVADIDALPFAPLMVNVKPSRFGPLSELFAAYDACRERGIAMYGGGQFELGPGRGQIQYLAALLHADAPNDVAPAGFHAADPPPGLPESPLDAALAPTGFRWATDAPG